jgi:restriction endonuclease Mrr
LKGLPRDERRALEKKFQQIDVFRHASPEELTSKRPSGTLRTEILILNREVAAYFARNPSKLHEVTPRQFEHLIAGILKDMGCDVELMKATRDGGRDIIAAFTTQFGKLLSIIQCKRYRHDNCVGLDVVERFLWTIEHKDRASCGIIVTTSYFSPDAQARAKEFEWKLKLRDLQGVQEWLGAYGTWIKDDSSQLWMPHGVRQPKQT